MPAKKKSKPLVTRWPKKRMPRARVAAIRRYEGVVDLLKLGFPLTTAKMDAMADSYIERQGFRRRPEPLTRECIWQLAAYTAAGYIVKNPDFHGAHPDARNACHAVARQMQNITPDKVYEIHGNYRRAIAHIRALFTSGELPNHVAPITPAR